MIRADYLLSFFPLKNGSIWLVNENRQCSFDRLVVVIAFFYLDFFTESSMSLSANLLSFLLSVFNTDLYGFMVCLNVFLYESLGLWKSTLLLVLNGLIMSHLSSFFLQ